MSKVKVNVKWGSKTFRKLELDLAGSVDDFKAQLFSLSNVPPDRQKIVVAGRVLKEGVDLKKMRIKNNMTFRMQGSADELIKAPTTKQVFLEDLPDEAQTASMSLALGLKNLGNTCYMNSSIQALKAIPELKSALGKFVPTGQDPMNNVTTCMKQVVGALEYGNSAVAPIPLVTMLRAAFPQFAQQRGGKYLQQDAEECWTALLQALRKLPRFQGEGGPPGESSILQIFQGEMTETMSCIGAPDEEKQIRKTTFQKIPCHIDGDTAFLGLALKNSLQEHIRKHSATLGGEAEYLKESKISQLPYYTTIQFVRFMWKQKVEKRAKICKPVSFPFHLDLYDLCTDELKQELKPYREDLSEVKKGADDPTEVTPPREMVNKSGIYELVAVLCHQGRYADGGHYVSYVRKGPHRDDWLLFNDEEVTPVRWEKIEALSGRGGADWHIAYLCIYRSKKVPEPKPAEEVKEEEAKEVDAMDTTA